ERPTVSDIEFLSYWVAVVGIHQAAYAARVELRRRSRDSGHWADTVLPLTQRLSRSRNRVTRTVQAKHLLEDGFVRHLFHEQRNVLENVSVVQSEATAEDMFAGAVEVISKTNARAEIFIVVVRQFAYVRVRKRIVKRDQLLICPAVKHV